MFALADAAGCRHRRLVALLRRDDRAVRRVVRRLSRRARSTLLDAGAGRRAPRARRRARGGGRTARRAPAGRRALRAAARAPARAGRRRGRARVHRVQRRRARAHGRRRGRPTRPGCSPCPASAPRSSRATAPRSCACCATADQISQRTLTTPAPRVRKAESVTSHSPAHAGTRRACAFDTRARVRARSLLNPRAWRVGSGHFYGRTDGTRVLAASHPRPRCHRHAERHRLVAGARCGGRPAGRASGWRS